MLLYVFYKRTTFESRRAGSPLPFASYLLFVYPADGTIAEFERFSNKHGEEARERIFRAKIPCTERGGVAVVLLRAEATVVAVVAVFPRPR